MGAFLADTYHLFLRHGRATLRLPIWIWVSLVQPVIWLFLFGQLFQRIIEIPGFTTASYIEFLTPGVVIMTAMFGAAWSGMGLIFDLDHGVMDRLLATPVNRGALIAARVLHAAVTATVEATIILALGLLLGAKSPSGILGLAVILVPALLVSAGFSALSNGIALLIRREENLIAIVNFVGLPLTFMSASFMSAALMPGWIRTLSQANPVNWAVEAARAALLGDDWWTVVGLCAALAAFAIAAAVFATRAFRVYLRST